MPTSRIAIVIRGSGYDPFTEHYKNYDHIGSEYTDDDVIFVAALEQAGHRVTPAPWNDESVDWASFDYCVVRSPWGFFFQREKFHAWLDMLEAVGANVGNSPEVLRGNISKTYLKRLADAGVQTLPTEIVKQGSAAALADLAVARGWTELVIKPACLGGAHGAAKASTAAAATLDEAANEILKEDDLIVQEFFPEIADGEWSFVFFGEQFSHAVKKVPKAGEWREQAQYGGGAIAATPKDELIAQARDARKVFAEGTLYSRVDAFEREGQLYVNEIELIDPRLFFASDAHAAGRLVAEVERRLTST